MTTHNIAPFVGLALFVLVTAVLPVLLTIR